MDMVSSADDNTPNTLSAELDATLKRLKDFIIKIYEWFHKKVLNLTLINAILSQSLSLKKKFKLERLL